MSAVQISDPRRPGGGDWRNAKIGAVVGFAVVCVSVVAGGLIGGIGVGSSLGLGLWVGFWGGAGFGFMLGGAIPSREASTPEG